MSCTYADGLSPYENKGVLGIAEKFDKETEVDEKCEKLAKWIEDSKHVVVHTGAGISTSAGIPDFRGPNGVWTLEKKGEKPSINISFNDAIPTRTHMALKVLIEKGYIHYIVSQNIDGLHMKSGLDRKYISELHGNMFVEQCSKCRRQYVRGTAAETVGQKPCGGVCKGGVNARPCRGGTLLDNVLDWEHDLPDRDLDMSLMHSTIADLNITLGTTLQIVPSGNLPLKNKRCGGKLIICNLQPTKHDKKAELLISTYVDDILIKLCKRLGVEIPEYSAETDPTRVALGSEWTLPLEMVKEMEVVYNQRLKECSKKRKSNGSYQKKSPTKLRKTEIVRSKVKDECSEEKKEPKEEKPQFVDKKSQTIEEEKVEVSEQKQETVEENMETSDEKQEVPEEKLEIPEEKQEAPEEAQENPEGLPEMTDEKQEVETSVEKHDKNEVAEVQKLTDEKEVIEEQQTTNEKQETIVTDKQNTVEEKIESVEEQGSL